MLSNVEDIMLSISNVEIEELDKIEASLNVENIIIWFQTCSAL